MKVVVAAQVDLEPAGRQEAIDKARELIENTLSQPGCIRYDWSIDVADPARVNVFEEWESEEALASHFAGPYYAGMLAHLGGYSILNAVSCKYRVDAEAPVYNEQGVATADF